MTTDHVSPAGSIRPTRRPASTSSSTASSARDFNSYGARRGNHEVMVRGTFANVRLKNLLVPGSEGTWTVHVPYGDEMTIFDASERYLAEGTPPSCSQARSTAPARRATGPRRARTSSV